MLIDGTEPAHLWSDWSLEPSIVLPLAVAAGLYIIGWYRVSRRARRSGRRRWQAVAFAAGWLTLAIALLSPLHPLGEALLSAHMAQHALLMVVAAPLLVLSRPLVPWLWALPIEWRRSLGRLSRSSLRALWRILIRPGVAWSLHAAAILIWHLPRLYQAGLTSEALHAMQHLSFLATALLFWWALMHGSQARAGAGAAILYVTLTSVYTGAFGMILSFAHSPLYPMYVGRTAVWGLSPLEDQQLAGLIMWIPGGLGYLLAALAFAARWVSAPDRVRHRSIHPLPIAQ